MAKGLNEVKLIGNVGNEPVKKSFDNGNSVVQLSLATSRTYINKSNQEKVTQTEWHNIVAWNKVGEIIEKYVSKGDQVYLSGEIRNRKYTTESGETRYVTEIFVTDVILLEKKGANTSENSNTQPPSPRDNFNEEEHDDLPF